MNVVSPVAGGGGGERFIFSYYFNRDTRQRVTLGVVDSAVHAQIIAVVFLPIAIQFKLGCRGGHSRWHGGRRRDCELRCWRRWKRRGCGWERRGCGRDRRRRGRDRRIGGRGYVGRRWRGVGGRGHIGRPGWGRRRRQWRYGEGRLWHTGWLRPWHTRLPTSPGAASDQGQGNDGQHAPPSATQGSKSLSIG
jgi:hypothetical protein